MADYHGMLTGQQIDALPGLITTETQRATAAEQANAAAIAAEASERSSAVGAEATAREAGDAAVAAAITAEATARANAVSTEATARQTGDAEITAALTTVDGKVTLNDEITAAILANLNGRIAAIEESIKNGFAGLTVDNLFVKAGMRSYFFNGETDDDALVVVRGYAPNIIPKHYGQRWFDTVAKKWYKPQGITSVADWVVDN